MIFMYMVETKKKKMREDGIFLMSAQIMASTTLVF
jgi:hypothetical protein